MKARPLIQKGIFDLEKMFTEAQDDLATLRGLKAELKHRKLSRAVTLLKKVEAVLGTSAQLHGTATALPLLRDDLSPGIENPTCDNRTEAGPELVVEGRPGMVLDSVLNHRSVISPPVASARSDSGAGLIQSDVEGSLTIEQAYRTLGVPPTSSWEFIEQARRTLVNRAHPDRVASLSEEQRELAQAGARRINDAYAALVRGRQKT